MTALIFSVHSNQIIVAMDTMSTDLLGKPNGYTSKFFPIQHLNGLMCVTGLSNFAFNWLTTLLRFVAKDIAHLDNFVVPVLQNLWQTYDDCGDATATVYHFGYSREHDRYVAFAYRSANNFASEPLSDGLRTKPGLRDPNIESLGDFATAMRRQREEQEQIPIDARVFIGGEIQLAILEKQTITIHTLDRFDDYEDMYDVICEQFPLPD